MIFNMTSGSGSELNFTVKAYASKTELLAAVPKENTIGIITTTQITSWIFSATEPEAPATGTVWILTGTESPIEFNALKKNGVQVYPISAKQYVGGVWIDKTAKSRRGGAWVDWWNGIIYDRGIEDVNITGGFSKVGTATLNNRSDDMFTTSSTGGVYTNNKVNLSGYKKVVFEWTSNVDEVDTRFLISTVRSSSYTDARSFAEETDPIDGESYVTEVNIPEDGEYYIGFGRFYSGTTTEFYVERIYAVR